MTTIKISDDAFNAAMAERKPVAKPARKSPHPALIAVGVIAGLTFLGSLLPKTKVAKIPAQMPTLQVAVDKEGLSMDWDCQSIIKSQLRDPESFRHASSRHFVQAEKPEANTLQVRTVVNYRAKNGFGGYVPGRAACLSSVTHRGGYSYTSATARTLLWNE